MENHPSISYTERSKIASEKIDNSIIGGVLEILKSQNEKGVPFSEMEWLSFEHSLGGIGFIKNDEAKRYLKSVATLYGGEILVRRANMQRLLTGMENNNLYNVSPLDSEPNATLLGSHAEGVESALTSGFGWLVEGKVVGVFGFTNEHSNLNVENIKQTSLSHHKKDGHLMRRISGDITKEDVLFTLFRIHKSIYPESLLENYDYDETTGEVNPFIVRLYTKNRQTH